jgi:hypothetical protein
VGCDEWRAVHIVLVSSAAKGKQPGGGESRNVQVVLVRSAVGGEASRWWPVACGAGGAGQKFYKGAGKWCNDKSCSMQLVPVSSAVGRHAGRW